MQSFYKIQNIYKMQSVCNMQSFYKIQSIQGFSFPYFSYLMYMMIIPSFTIREGVLIEEGSLTEVVRYAITDLIIQEFIESARILQKQTQATIFKLADTAHLIASAKQQHDIRCAVLADLKMVARNRPLLQDSN